MAERMVTTHITIGYSKAHALHLWSTDKLGNTIELVLSLYFEHVVFLRISNHTIGTLKLYAIDISVPVLKLPHILPQPSYIYCFGK